MSDYFTGCEVCETNARTYGVMTAECKVDELGEEVARLKAEVAALKAAAQWRPIEEAPYDVELLLTDGANVISGNKYRGWWNFAKGTDFTPTHFRVLPALPEGGA